MGRRGGGARRPRKGKNLNSSARKIVLTNYQSQNGHPCIIHGQLVIWLPCARRDSALDARGMAVSKKDLTPDLTGLMVQLVVEFISNQVVQKSYFISQAWNIYMNE